MKMPCAVPAQPLENIMERHKEIARRLVAGEQPVTISAALNISQSRLSIIQASPIFKAYISELSAKADAAAIDIHAKIKANAEEGVLYLGEVICDKLGRFEPKLKVAAAIDQLDRAGFAAVRKVESLSAVLTADDITRLRERRATLQTQPILTLEEVK